MSERTVPADTIASPVARAVTVEAELFEPDEYGQDGHVVLKLIGPGRSAAAFAIAELDPDAAVELAARLVTHANDARTLWTGGLEPLPIACRCEPGPKSET